MLLYMKRCPGLQIANILQVSSTSRSTQDTKDMIKLVEWFDQHDPFNVEVSSLTSLSSGLPATDEDMANCDQADEVGKKIQNHLIV